MASEHVPLEVARTARPRFSKKVIAVVVAAIVLVTCLIAWFGYLRYWTTEDLAGAVVFDDGHEMLGFRHDLAGDSVLVRGKVTDVEVRKTTQGDLTFLEFDDFPYIRVVQWGSSEVELGDKITREVHFEWSVFNEEEQVYSPQLSYPLLQILPAVEVVIRAVSTVQGGYLLADNAAGDDVVIQIKDVAEPAPIGECNCTLRAGCSRGPTSEYMSLLGGYRFGVEIDSMESLGDEESTNGIVRFVDYNENGLLDGGDYFLLSNLDRPEVLSGVMTYLMIVGVEPPSETYDEGVYFSSYLVVTSGGVLRYFDPSQSFGRLESEPEPVPSGYSFTYAYIDPGVSWGEVSILVSDSYHHNSTYPDIAALSAGVGVTAEAGTITLGSSLLFVNVTDLEGNGLIDAGDSITLTCSGSAPFNPETSYMLAVIYEATKESIGRCTFET